MILFPANQLAKQAPPAVTRQVECADLRVLPRLWIENVDEEVEGKIIRSLLHPIFLPGNEGGDFPSSPHRFGSCLQERRGLGARAEDIESADRDTIVPVLDDLHGTRF